MSDDNTYFLRSNAADSELRRLQVIERQLDPLSRQLITDAGIGAGKRCLEVGAGAGSMLRWLSGQVGASGEVMAVDLDTKYLSDCTQPNIRLIRDDIRQITLPSNYFDIVHCRNVLTHIFEWASVCRALVAALKPGGFLIIEEPDFAVARWLVARHPYREAFANFFFAFEHFSKLVGMQFDFGRRVPAILQVNQLEELRVINDEPIAQGGSAQAQMIRESSSQLGPMFVGRGLLQAEDLNRFIEFVEDPESWAIYMATIRGVGRKAR